MTRDNLAENDIKAHVDAINKQLELRLDSENFLFMPGSKIMFKLDKYDNFHTPTGGVSIPGQHPN